MPIAEKQIRRELGDVPPLPDTLYPAVMRRIRSRGRVRTALWALAATLALAVGLGLHTGTGVQRTSTPVATEELAEEMYSLCDFVNGGSIDDELDLFAGGDAF